MTNSRKCELDCYSETDGRGTFQDDITLNLTQMHIRHPLVFILGMLRYVNSGYLQQAEDL